MNHKDKEDKMEDKMVEIISEEHNKVKRIKRTEDSLRDPRAILNEPTLEL